MLESMIPIIVALIIAFFGFVMTIISAFFWYIIKGIASDNQEQNKRIAQVEDHRRNVDTDIYLAQLGIHKEIQYIRGYIARWTGEKPPS